MVSLYKDSEEGGFEEGEEGWRIGALQVWRFEGLVFVDAWKDKLTGLSFFEMEARDEKGYERGAFFETSCFQHSFHRCQLISSPNASSYNFHHASTQHNLLSNGSEFNIQTRFRRFLFFFFLLPTPSSLPFPQNFFHK